MKKILLVCNTGVTTSLLVNKIRQGAEGYALDADIQAMPLSDAVEHLSDVDVVLLSPQVGFAKAQLQEGTDKPITVIDADVYARADASSILAEALKLIAE